MSFKTKHGPFSQAGRRGFESRLPLHDSKAPIAYYTFTPADFHLLQVANKKGDTNNRRPAYHGVWRIGHVSSGAASVHQVSVRPQVGAWPVRVERVTRRKGAVAAG